MRKKVKLILAEASSSTCELEVDESKDVSDEMSSDAVEPQVELTSMHVDDPKIVTSLSFGQVRLCL